jgi:hypothetical protein
VLKFKFKFSDFDEQHLHHRSQEFSLLDVVTKLLKTLEANLL